MKTVMMALGLATIAAATPAMAADVTVTLTGIKPKGGEIHVALYDKDGFLRTPRRTVRVKGAGDSVTVTAGDVPPGDYAIAAFHDADGNGTMTMKDGRMTEGTAMSNGEALRGMPTFEVTRVAVPAAGARFTLAMSYPEDRQYW